MMTRGAVLRTAWTGLCTLVCVTAVIGWMHTPRARPVLAALGVPCSANKVTRDQVELICEAGLATLRGHEAAPARPALGMNLEHTTEADARVWADAHGAKCETAVHGYRYLHCRGVPARALTSDGPAITDLWLSFGVSGTLVGIDAYRRGIDASGTRAAWLAATGGLQSKLGKPAVAFGDPSPAALMSSALQTARVQYRYTNYIATVTVAHLARSGLSIREQYMSATL